MSIIPIKMKALTDIWTGGVESKDGSKLHLTGIKGSIRWWFEALVRGLGGYACDPRSKDEKFRCEFDAKNFKKTRNIAAELKKICLVCELFGCTNWSAKLNLSIRDRKLNGVVIDDDSRIGKDETFTLEFIERREMSDLEKTLLNATIKLIVEYGAIGGKTTLKPSDHGNNKDDHHLDFGIIGVDSDGKGDEQSLTAAKREELNKELNEMIKKATKKMPDDWPRLNNFWFVQGAHINREEHNTIVCRIKTETITTQSNIRKKFITYIDTANASSAFLGGYSGPADKKTCAVINRKKELPLITTNTKESIESKKLFSFHGEVSNVQRCFGYGRNAKERNDIKDKVEKKLDGKISKPSFVSKTGEQVLDELFGKIWRTDGGGK